MVASLSKALARKIFDQGAGGATTLRANWLWAPLSSSSFSTSSATAAQDEEKTSMWSKLLLFIPGAITFGLGSWQIVRRQEKIKVLEYRQNRLALEPVRVAPSSENLETLEFRKLQCRGIWDDESSIYIGPRSRSISGVTENGCYVITPLLPVVGDPESMQLPILVNRGWVPRAWRDKALEGRGESRLSSSVTPPQENNKDWWWRFLSSKDKISEDDGGKPKITTVEVIGVVRGSEKPSVFVPANDPRSSQWFYVDVPAIARVCNLPESTMYVEDVNEDVDPSHPYPMPKDINTLMRSSVMPQDHLNYTLTWYSLSAAVSFMAFKRLKSRRWK